MLQVDGGMGQSTENIEQWEQICQKYLFLDNFIIRFVQKC